MLVHRWLSATLPVHVYRILVSLLEVPGQVGGRLVKDWHEIQSKYIDGEYTPLIQL